MRFSYDGAHDALLVTFRDAKYDDSKEIYPGFVVDFDADGVPMGLDIYYGASKIVDIAVLRQYATETATVIADVPLRRKR